MTALFGVACLTGSSFLLACAVKAWLDACRLLAAWAQGSGEPKVDGTSVGEPSVSQAVATEPTEPASPEKSVGDPQAGNSGQSKPSVAGAVGEAESAALTASVSASSEDEAPSPTDISRLTARLSLECE